MILPQDHLLTAAQAAEWDRDMERKTDQRKVDAVAHAVYRHMIPGTLYEYVPEAEAFSRPRYSHLKDKCYRVAEAALAALKN